MKALTEKTGYHGLDMALLLLAFGLFLLLGTATPGSWLGFPLLLMGLYELAQGRHHEPTDSDRQLLRR